MQSEQTDAIILRLYPWSETSCIVTLFTREFGKQAVVAKGARRSRSPFEGALDLLSAIRVVFIPKAGDALGVLTEAKLTTRFSGARLNLLRLYCGFYVSELLDRLTEKHDPHPELYALASSTLSALGDERLEPRAVILRWELQLLRLLGHAPSLQRCAHCGDAVAKDSAVQFAPLVGGIVCDKCVSGLNPIFRIPAAARDELIKFSETLWQEMPLETLATTGRAATRAAMERYLASLLDRRFNLTQFLQELGH